jgi:hypothetical protein
MAGYNTLPQEEKKKYDVEGIASVFRNAMFFMAFVISLGYYISQWSEIQEIKFYSFYGALVIGIPYLLINSNKNKYKDQIENGDYKAIQKEMLDPLAEDFINLVKTNLPNVSEEHLKGDDYYAQDVTGVFVDAIGNFDYAVAELNKLIDEQKQTANSSNHSNTYTMEKQYSKVNAALGVEALESEEAGIYLQEEQIAALDAALDQSATENQLTQLQNDLATAQATQADLKEQLETAQANNAKLVEQIENAGATNAAGASKGEEEIPGAKKEDEFENSASTKYARAKLDEY